MVRKDGKTTCRTPASSSRVSVRASSRYMQRMAWGEIFVLGGLPGRVVPAAELGRNERKRLGDVDEATRGAAVLQSVKQQLEHKREAVFLRRGSGPTRRFSRGVKEWCLPFEVHPQKAPGALQAGLAAVRLAGATDTPTASRACARCPMSTTSKPTFEQKQRSAFSKGGTLLFSVTYSFSAGPLCARRYSVGVMPVCFLKKFEK